VVDTVFFQPWFQSTLEGSAVAVGAPVVTYQVDSGGREDSSINDMLTPGFCDECSKLTAGRCAKHTFPVTHIGDPVDPFTPFVPRVFITPPTVLRVGWRCPDCRRCYAPDVVACTRCGPQDPEPSLGMFTVTGK